MYVTTTKNYDFFLFEINLQYIFGTTYGIFKDFAISFSVANFNGALYFI
jgi:hypothetical protein